MTMNAIVLGNGRSGKAAAKLLSSEGCRVIALDGADVWPEGDWDICVTSPGIPLDHPWQKAARAAGVRVISELQLGAERYKTMGGRMFAVTGSKGKSSVVKLVADALDGVPCGNYGKPLCEVVLDARESDDGGEWSVESGEWRVKMEPAPGNSFKRGQICRKDVRCGENLPIAVVEVSSFQMETTELPADAFEAAAILNLQEDHLDRHGSVEAYHALKRKLLDFARVKITESGESEEGRGNPGADSLKSDKNYSRRKLFEGSCFDNPVLESNGECAVDLLRVAGLGDEAIRAAFLAFEALPHRMQPVGEFDGVTYIDDSKATSISALIAGVTMACSRFSDPLSTLHSPLSTLDSPPRHVRLIAGGLPKGDDPSEARDCLAKRVAKVYLIGQCAETFEAAWKDVVPCDVCGDLDSAFSIARREARKGDCVLLSPGTASFDQFDSYMERGERFADLAKSHAIV